MAEETRKQKVGKSATFVIAMILGFAGGQYTDQTQSITLERAAVVAQDDSLDVDDLKQLQVDAQGLYDWLENRIQRKETLNAVQAVVGATGVTVANDTIDPIYVILTKDADFALTLKTEQYAPLVHSYVENGAKVRVDRAITILNSL